MNDLMFTLLVLAIKTQQRTNKIASEKTASPSVIVTAKPSKGYKGKDGALRDWRDWI